MTQWAGKKAQDCKQQGIQYLREAEKFRQLAEEQARLYVKWEDEEKRRTGIDKSFLELVERVKAHDKLKERSIEESIEEEAETEIKDEEG